VLDHVGSVSFAESGPTPDAGRAGNAPLPESRGELSRALFAALGNGNPWQDASPAADSDADAQIALWVLYELHYHGLASVPAEREWDPDLLRLRRRLESDFEERLRSRAPALDGEPHDPVQQLIDLIEGHIGASISHFVQRQADADHVRELLRHRSIYHLKEADPTAWVVPRLGVRSKAALMELQFDEYGDGDPNRLHHHLFRRGMAESGLCARYGHYIDEAPVEILELNNAMSLFGLHRRLRGAMLGHLAAFEATSSLPSRRLAQGLRRLGLGESLVQYYTEHVEADAVHEQLALRTICSAFHAEEPDEWPIVLLGAFSCLDLEDRYARRMLTRWGAL
jgi:hypothetical protein